MPNPVDLNRDRVPRLKKNGPVRHRIPSHWHPDADPVSRLKGDPAAEELQQPGQGKNPIANRGLVQHGPVENRPEPEVSRITHFVRGYQAGAQRTKGVEIPADHFIFVSELPSPG